MKHIKKLGFVIFFLLILFLISKYYLPQFLSYKKPVDSKNFLIEAWISYHEIEQAIIDYGNDPSSHFYIVGHMYPEIEPQRVQINQAGTELDENENTGIWLYANSSLSFELPSNLNYENGDTVKINVTAKGQESENRFAYFNVVINGECIGGAFSQINYQEYVFDWINSEEGIKTCYIKFNNDLMSNTSDRNLNIKSIKIDNKLLLANKGNTVYGRDLNNLTSGFQSQAEEVGNYLQNLGVDQKQISIINFEPVARNQTMAAAEKFKEYISSVSITDINVISSDIHSRRTWFTYQRIIGKQTQVGVLYYSSPNPEKIKALKKYPDLYYTMDEFLAYFVNWIKLTF